MKTRINKIRDLATDQPVHLTSEQLDEKDGYPKNPFSSKSLILIGTFLLLIGAVFSLFYFNPYFEEIHLERLDQFGGNALVYFGFSLLAANVVFLIYIFTLYLRYKVTDAVSDDALPTCTVIVPAYNEGELVYKTLTSLVQSDYPADKVQIISIDDGSKDDTWNWMRKAKDRKSVV